MEVARRHAPRDGVTETIAFAAHRRARARALQLLVRALPALGLRQARCARNLRGRRGAPGRDHGDGIQRRSTCRRSIPWGARSARDATTCRSPKRATCGSPGRIGARRRRPHGDPFPSSARSPISATSCAARGCADMEIAMDIAFQCAPDHPWVQEHPQWFRRRARTAASSIAENPPKKYEDIYPLDFDTRRPRRRSGTRCATSFLLWVGARASRSSASTIRTPSRFAFWEWLIGEVQRDASRRSIFLSEAFTRPRVMHRLAKLGLHAVVHLLHLAHDPGGAHANTSPSSPQRATRASTSAPTCWPNTPDILPLSPADGAPSGVFRIRPAARRNARGELRHLRVRRSSSGENRTRDPGVSEEYLDSREVRAEALGPLRAPKALRRFITKVNAMPAAASRAAVGLEPRLPRQPITPQLLCYSKRAGDDRILVAVNLDPQRTPSRAGSTLDAAALGLETGTPHSP